MITLTILLPTRALLTPLLPEKNEQITKALDNQNTTKNFNMESTSPDLHKNSKKLPQTSESPPEPQNDGNHVKNKTREIVTSLLTNQKEFNEKTENKQAKIIEEHKKISGEI